MMLSKILGEFSFSIKHHNSNQNKHFAFVSAGWLQELITNTTINYLCALTLMIVNNL